MSRFSTPEQSDEFERNNKNKKTGWRDNLNNINDPDSTFKLISKARKGTVRQAGILDKTTASIMQEHYANLAKTRLRRWE